MFETEDRNVLSYGQIEVFIDRETEDKLVFMDPTGKPLVNAITSTLQLTNIIMIHIDSN